MAQQPDLPGPTTSYSDPFYDRLESLAQRITKRLWLVLLALVVIIVAAVVTHASLSDTPIAASANQFLNAATLRMEAEQARDPVMRAAKLADADKAFVAVAADEAVTPYYRARANLELAQLQLDRSELTAAKASVEKARAFAAKAGDPDLDLAIGLSAAAVQLQNNELPAAEATYLSVEKAAGSTYPDRQIAATLGCAQALVAQNRSDEAIAKLEPLLTRSDSNAAMLLNLAKNQYWTLKRRPAAAPAPAAGQPTAAPAPAAAAAPGAAAVPVAPSSAVAAPAAAPTPAVAPVAAPAAPAPVPAASPEGGK